MVLPVELQLLIVEHLASDPSSLRRCSLICSAWHHVARPILYRDVLLQYTEDVQHVTAAILATPSLASYVKSVTIQPPWTAVHVFLKLGLTRFWGLPTKLKPRGNLKSIHRERTPLYAIYADDHDNILNRDEDGSATQLVTDLLRKLPSVSTLSMSLCFIHEHAMDAVISSIATLKELEVNCCSPVFSPGYQSQPIAQSLDLERFTLIAPLPMAGGGIISTRSMLAHVARCRIGQDVTTLMLDQFSPREGVVKSTLKVIHHYTSTLVELHIRFRHRDFLDSEVPGLVSRSMVLMAGAVSHLAALRVLLLTDASPGQAGWPSIIHLIRRLTSQSLQTLRLAACFEVERYHEEDHREATRMLHSRLYAARATLFPSLTRVVFAHYGQDLEYWKDLMRRVHAPLEEAELLHLVAAE